jgi:hypothetical protein
MSPQRWPNQPVEYSFSLSAERMRPELSAAAGDGRGPLTQAARCGTYCQSILFLVVIVVC